MMTFTDWMIVLGIAALLAAALMYLSGVKWRRW